MKNNKTFFIILAVFLVVLVGAYLLYRSLGDQFSPRSLSVQDTAAPQQPQDTAAAEETKQIVPDFTVTDQDRNQVSLHNFLGKPIILNFWASWCGPCKSEMPDFEDAYKFYGEDIHFLIVNMTDGSRETVETAADYITQQGYTFPVYYDTTLDAAMTYRVYSIPTTYFIDAEGNVVAQHLGALDSELLQQGISLLLPEE